MSRSDPSTVEVMAELSLPAPLAAPFTRRRFMQAGAGVAASAWALSHWTGKALAAPLTPSDGILVMILMPGGNDGLNTVIPTGDGAYFDRRKSLAIPASAALTIAPGVALHPALTTIKARYDTGSVAVVRGVGNPGGDLSHFSNMAAWMTASPGGAVRTGWLGRYLDGLAPATLNGVAIGDSVPLHMVGARSAASAIPPEDSALFGTSTEAADLRLFGGIRGLGAAPTGRGAPADALGRLGVACIDTASLVFPALSPVVKGASLVQQLTLAARLINLNVGIRVFAVSHGDHDTHANQLATQATNLADFDAAVAAFYATLAPERARQVLLSTFSEFGRRVETNGSGGTDHGTANTMLLLGPAVRSGIHGDQPSLTALDADGDLKPNIDFRSVYSTVLHRWLNADASAVLGASVSELDLFVSGPSGPPLTPASPGGRTGTGRPAAGGGYRVLTADGSVAGFGRSGLGGVSGTAVAMASSASADGYWVATNNGMVRAFGDAAPHGDLQGVALSRPIVGMAATAAGDGYRLLGADGGIFCFGNAAFHGSEGGVLLNRDVVGIASHPGGGYWFVASDGGIFSFGSAGFHGSTGGSRLNRPIVGMTPTPSGNGYWLVASDGGIFSFGDAVFYGSTGGIRLTQPIVGIAASGSGHGYRLIASDGGIFCFGDATFAGSLVGSGGRSPAVAISA